jgi:hypothetical protein
MKKSFCKPFSCCNFIQVNIIIIIIGVGVELLTVQWLTGPRLDQYGVALNQIASHLLNHQCKDYMQDPARFRFYGTLLGAQLTDDPRLSKMAREIEVNYIQRELKEGLKEDHSMISKARCYDITYLCLLVEAEVAISKYYYFFVYSTFQLLGHACICLESPCILSLPRGYPLACTLSGNCSIKGLWSKGVRVRG